MATIALPATATTVPWWKEPTKAQWASFLAALFGWVLDAFDFNIYILVIPDLIKEFHTSLTVVNSIVGATLVMRLVGGVFAGRAADRWGRRVILMASILLFALCDGAIYFAPSMKVILALRILFGFAMGGEYAAGTTMAMENWPERSRGTASGILQGSWGIGYILAAAVTRFVVPHFGWRPLFLVAALPALLVVPIRYFVPEGHEQPSGTEEESSSSMLELFRGKLFVRVLCASLTMGAVLFGYYAFTSTQSTMYRSELHVPLGTALTYVMIFHFGNLAGCTLWGRVASRRGIKTAVVVPALLSLLILPLFIGVIRSSLGLGAGAFFAGALGVGWIGIVPLYLTSLFPARVRATAVGLTYNVGVFISAACPTLIARLNEHALWPLSKAILILAGASELILVGLILLQQSKATSASRELASGAEQDPLEPILGEGVGA